MWHQFKNTRFYRIVTNNFFVAGLVFLVWICFFDKNNLLGWTDALSRLSSLKKERSYYRAQIQRTETQLRELQSNRDSLEKFAREQYFFLREGEDVYVLDSMATTPERQ